ncbi:hypothetical protein ACQRXC_28785 (plasmid) [Niallia taxi]|uniref:WxL domain-containing protein n=1 Tax=Niallia circulans TaxID=1397 RepID=A0A553SQL7_NIACI|nr:MULTISPECIES: hypothetical protein [Niallia]MED4057146.1 hypothetical protein [Niallia taxi]MED4122166.1 hypothetical protein [Niallia taxi]TRZ39281.1 hypothetical protein CEQ21_07895 [Niallia circulans]
MRLSKSKFGILALTGVMSLGFLFGGNSAFAAEQATTKASTGIQSGGYNVSLTSPQDLNPTVTVGTSTQKVVIGKIPTINVEDLTGTGSNFSLKVSATELTEKTPSGGFKTGSSALKPFNSMVLKTNSSTISNPNVTFSGTSGINLAGETSTTLYSGSNAGGTTTITADNEIYVTVAPNKVTVDPVNYPGGPTPYETTVKLSVVQGL